MFKTTLQEKNTSKHDSPDQRTERAIFAVNVLLQTAKVLYSWKGVTIYSKPGGYSQALSDFQRLGPQNVHRYSKLMWGEVGDRTVSVQSVHDRPVMYLWKHNKNSDGSSQLIVDKIQYF